MGKQLRVEDAYYNLPRGHQDVIGAIMDANPESCPGGPDGHDPDVVYSARLRVRDAFCMKCGSDLTIPKRDADADAVRTEPAAVLLPRERSAAGGRW